MIVGEPKHIYIDVPLNLNTTSGHLRPPEGMEWVHGWLYALHNNVAGTASAWSITDGTNTHILVSATMAGSAALWFGDYTANVNGVLTPLKWNHDVYPVYDVVTEAGKFIRVCGYVIERPRNYDLLFQEVIAHHIGVKLPIQSRE